jgi:hypothetical protein
MQRRTRMASKAEIGTVVWGTMRPEDLIPVFYETLEELDPDGAAAWIAYWKEFAPLVHGDAEDFIAMNFDDLDPDLVNGALEDLFDELNKLAPEGCYFGSHPGDGSDYGFWPAEDQQEEEEEEEPDDDPDEEPDEEPDEDLPYHEYVHLMGQTELCFSLYYQANPTIDCATNEYVIALRREYLRLARLHVKALERWFAERGVEEA